MGLSLFIDLSGILISCGCLRGAVVISAIQMAGIEYKTLKKL